MKSSLLKNIQALLAAGVLFGMPFSAMAEDDEDSRICTSSEVEEESNSFNHFTGVSNEILQYIFSYLHGIGFQAAEHTCQRFRANAQELTRVRLLQVEVFKKEIYQEVREEGKITALVIGNQRAELSEDSAKEVKRGLLFHLCRGGYPLAQRAVQAGLNIIEHLGLEDVLSERTRSTGHTFLQAATIAGNNAFIRILLTTAQPNINTRDHEGSTALHLAVIYGRTAALTLLLNAGADPNTTDIPGNTPLHIAAERGQETMVRILIAGGTNINARDIHGQTAADLAAARGYQNIVAILSGEELQEIEIPSNSTQIELNNNENPPASSLFIMHASL